MKTVTGRTCSCLVIGLLAFVFLGLSSMSAHAKTKIAPTAAEPGHPFTVIDTKNRRLVDGTSAVFKLRGIEFVVPLRTHKPFNTANGRLAKNMHGGTYDVLVRRPDGLEFGVGDFTVYGAPAPSVPVLYDFNEAVQTSASIGPLGGSITFEDGYGAFFTLDLPAAAVAVETEITLTSIASVANFPAGIRVLTAVRLQPSGLSFGSSPHLLINLPAGSRSGNPAVGFLSNEDGTGLTFLPLSGTDPVAAALSDAQVALSLAHFSVAGVAEADGSGDFPPPPANMTAEERSMTAIAERLVELFAAGTDIFGDQQIADALFDWFSNLDDGLGPRSGQTGAAPDSITMENLHALSSGEATRLLDEARAYMTGSQLDLLEAEVLDAMSDLIESYRNELTFNRCEEDTRGAQLELNALKTLSADFDDGALGPDFAGTSFFCSYEVVVSPLFRPAFIDDLPLEIPYDIILQGGSTFSGSFENLSEEFGIPSARIEIQNGTIESDYPSLLVTPGLIGPASIAIQIVDSPQTTVDILWLPSFLGNYIISGSGTATRCIDDFDAGAGGGMFTAFAPGQTLIGADETSATIQFSLVGARLTSFVATVNLSSINAGLAVGGISGNITYAYTEYDEEDQQSYPVVGGGAFSGTITASNSNRIANISYGGSSNWCESYFGTGVIASQ